MKPRALALLAALGLACASPLTDIAPGSEPELEADEAGFWMAVEKLERDVATSGNRMNEPELETYLHGVVCRVAPEYCDATRVYVVRAPGLNASMAPNGMLVVWSGLLIRAQNEAQLATVLGHEVGHYQRRHTLSSYRALRKTSTTVAALAVLTGPLVPMAGAAGGLIGTGAITAYSREQEAEADQIGLERMARAGYDPREAAALWNGAVQEERADERAPRVPIFATHPPSAERWLELRERAVGLVTPENDRHTRAQTFDEAVRRFRASLLSDEVAMRKHARTSLLIDRLLQAEILSPGDAAFYHGELYRVRDEPGDVERAIACYREAIASGQVLPVAYRSLGLLLRRVGDREGARAAFLRYRELAPEASDRAMIDAYLADLG